MPGLPRVRAVPTIGNMVLLTYQVLIVPRKRPPVKRPKARKPSARRGVGKASAPATLCAPSVVRTLSRASLATTASETSTASSTDWSDTASSVSAPSIQRAPTPLSQPLGEFERLCEDVSIFSVGL